MLAKMLKLRDYLDAENEKAFIAGREGNKNQ
ncbi:MAG: hypothetical protein KIIPBIDF_01163 [Candidatus Methanoperedenaceae archaeon GB50]|nr:MAG: hypothetical protein KIIPBIDF_01163 [Candidatus Methanoperedenaceae archaeon GB50]